MNQIYLHLLGDFRLTVADKPVTTLETSRLRPLLAYLALHRQAVQSRQHLAFVFWPDSAEAQALTNLRKQLHYLQQALPVANQLLHITRQTVHWLPSAPAGLDVADFAALLARANTAAADQAIWLLGQAIDLYRGDLLPECYDDWIFALREEWREQYASALARLILLLEEQRDYPTAITYAQRLLRHDPLHEPTYRTLLRLYALQGDRAAALRVYHTCVTQLREELGVDPDAETQAIYERLLHGVANPTPQPERAAHAPFVGRQPEWQTLQQRWRLALLGQPQFVLIAGEAGIGKTRLAEELLGWAMHQGFATVRARCYAAEGRLTYGPVIEWLRAEKVRSQRSRLATTWLTELTRLLPEIRSDQPNLPALEPMTQSAQRHHLFEAVTRALLVGEQPLLLLIDDLQWCDKETLELLHFLLRNAATLSQTPLLLLGTARLPDEVEATHPLHELLNPLRGSDSLTQLDLARLTAAETSDLARQMVEEALDARSLHQLFADTAGNPLFVVETLRASQGQPLPTSPLAREGTVDGTPVSLEASTALVQALPPKILATIQARLGQLSAPARELTAWAAIIGRAFTLDLLVSASQLALDKAVAALDELWQRRIIREQGTDAYDFSHDRIRDVAAGGVSRVRRKYLHRRVAEALERQFDGQLDSISGQIAVHYDAAGVTESAIHFYERAAIVSLQVYVNHQVVTYLERALHLLINLPEGKARDERELSFLNILGPALAAITVDNVTRLHEVFGRVYYLSQQLGVQPNLALLRISAVHKIGLKGLEQAERTGHYFLELAQQSSAIEPIFYVEGSYLLGVTAFWQGNFARSRLYLQQAVDNYSVEFEERHIAEYGQATGYYCQNRLGLTLWYLGFPDQARQQVEASLTLANAAQHRITTFHVLIFGTWCMCDSRNAIDAQAWLRLLTTNVGTDTSLANIHIDLMSGWLAFLRGEFQTSIARLCDYSAMRLKWKPDSSYGLNALLILAQAYRQVGNFQQGLATIAQGFSLLEDGQTCWCFAELHRIKGELLIGQSEFLDGEACFQQALEISRRQAAKSLELRAAMSLARLWDQQGKRGEARELLAEVYNWFTEGFDTADLQEAKALLERLA